MHKKIIIRQSDLDSAKRWIKSYKTLAADYEAKAESCLPNQRGGYRAQASIARKDAERWRKNLVFMEACIKELKK